jgi:hypothetical protein
MILCKIRVDSGAIVCTCTYSTVRTVHTAENIYQAPLLQTLSSDSFPSELMLKVHFYESLSLFVFKKNSPPGTLI